MGSGMTKDDIIRMAQEAGVTFVTEFGVASATPEWLERFAKLIYEATFRDANIAASRTILDAAVLEEREACAQILDHNANACANNSVLRDVLQGNAAAIRARRQA